MIDNKKQLLSLFERKSKVVEIAGGQEIEIRELTVRDKADYLDFFNENSENQFELLAFLVCRSCAFLNDDDREDVLTQMSGDTLSKISNAVLDLSGMMPEAGEAAEKN